MREGDFGLRPSGRKRRMVHKEKPYDWAHVVQISGPGFGGAQCTLLPHKEGCNAKNPNEMWPVTDGSVLPKPDRAPREFPSNYVFAKGPKPGMGSGCMFWSKNETHLREKPRDRMTREIAELEDTLRMSGSLPLLRQTQASRPCSAPNARSGGGAEGEDTLSRPPSAALARFSMKQPQPPTLSRTIRPVSAPALSRNVEVEPNQASELVVLAKRRQKQNRRRRGVAGAKDQEKVVVNERLQLQELSACEAKEKRIARNRQELDRKTMQWYCSDF